jgi:O-antigen biosynthesis protein
MNPAISRCEGHPMQCSIILLYYRDYQYTEKAIQSILNHTKDVDYEIILVCNREDPDILAVIEKYQIKKYCLLSTNVGFGRGNNVGFQMAEGEFICIFNDDLQVLTDGWLLKMLAPFEDPEIGVVAAEVNKITYIRGKCTSRRALDMGYRRDQLKKIGYPFYGVGCLAVYRSRDLHIIGGFDPVYTPCAWEDVDLSYRLDQFLSRKICLVDDFNWDHPFRVSHGAGKVEYMGKTESITQIAARNQRTGFDRWFNTANE